ncbi:MAG: hypothetical protein GXO58_06715 [Thermodesulfobacteria bacterium]|nr:hypothetical protein [Thermodesulfobacteriota bacterium]
MKKCFCWSVPFLIAMILALWAGKSPVVHAQPQDPLLQVLIKKGILTEKEAEEIQAEAEALKRQEKERLAKEIRQEATPKAFRGLKFKMLAYLDYSIGETAESHGGQESYNRFTIKRGYFRVYKRITPWLQGHLTYDVRQDDTGDWKARLKYLYAEFRTPDLGLLTNMKAEFGLGHIPWLDFEEHVNPYRCQGTMPIERAGTFNSADLGVSLRGYLGGELEDALARTGNHHYAGRYGSWHLGVYNGSGYHAKENNGNKVIEGRLTIRPLPDIIPGLQLSYFGLYGEANQRATQNGEFPDYQVQMGYMSFEHPRLILTAQYFVTEGNKDGNWLRPDGKALWTENYSFFVNVRPPVYLISPWLDRRLNLFFRYDHIDRDKDHKIASDAKYDLYIGGGALEIVHGNYVLVDYEYTDFGRDFGNKHSAAPSPGNDPGNEHKFQMVYQLKF